MHLPHFSNLERALKGLPGDLDFLNDSFFFLYHIF